jgi:hypothetical protein
MTRWFRQPASRPPSAALRAQGRALLATFLPTFEVHARPYLQPTRRFPRLGQLRRVVWCRTLRDGSATVQWRWATRPIDGCPTLEWVICPRSGADPQVLWQGPIRPYAPIDLTAGVNAWQHWLDHHRPDSAVCRGFGFRPWSVHWWGLLALVTPLAIAVALLGLGASCHWLTQCWAGSRFWPFGSGW